MHNVYNYIYILHIIYICDLKHLETLHVSSANNKSPLNKYMLVLDHNHLTENLGKQS